MGFQPKPDHISFTAKEIWKRKTEKFRFLFCKPAGAYSRKTLSSQTRFAQTSSQAYIFAGNKIYEINMSEGLCPSEPSQ